ncbi:MAG: aspartate aminotransferase family protein, partial [Clostridia bacterium]
LGIKLKNNISSTAVAKKAIENGLLVLTAKDKLRLLPPLNISSDDLIIGVEILNKTINSFS